MKQYPRIHSLSTIGLRQHQEFDYKFHPFRTDFVGDAGCGKSMIADLLQLIFVGADAFKSPTKSTDTREPKGMVLPISQSRGAGMGYAFLNIEVERGAFIVVGIYLHDTDNTVEHYTIQSGYDADHLHLFRTPLTVKDLGLDSQVPSLNEFGARIEKRGLVYKHRPRKKFHRWLFDNKLLTMDLSADKTLKDYASIIQSFSRGHALRLTDSDSLKDFLFGPEKGAELFARFNRAVAEMQEATRQYGRNQADIEEAARRWRDIHHLEKAKDDCDAARRALLTAESAYCYQQEVHARKQVQELIVGIKDSSTSLEVYHENIGAWLQMSDSQAAELEQRSTAARRDFVAVEKKHEVLQMAQSVRDGIGCKTSELREVYERNRIGLDNAARFAQLTNALKQAAVTPLFQKLFTPQISVADLQDEIEGLHLGKKSELERQHALLRFAQMNVEGKLGSWAIGEGKVLSREAESVLMYMKDWPLIRTINPQERDRVVTRPDVLFQNIATTPDEAAGGFWLSLNGTEEFVRYVREQLFSEEGIKTLPEQLSALAAVSQQAIDALEAEAADLTKLRDVLRNVPGGAKEALAAYSYFEFEKNSAPNKDLNIPAKEFEGYLDALENEASIAGRYAVASAVMDEAAKKKAKFDALAEEMRALKTEVRGIFDGSRWTDQLREVEQEMLPASYYNDRLAVSKQAANDGVRTASLSTFYRTKIAEAKNAHRTSETLEAYKRYKEAVRARNDQWRAYSATYGGEPIANLIELGYVDEPVEERNTSMTASATYEAQFGQIVKLYVTDQYKFEQSKDYDELCATVLPDILGKNRPAGLSNIEAFEKYSRDINEKNKGLNARKLQKIKELLDDVHNEVGTRMHNARSIDIFLNRKEREITGGFRVRLEQKHSRQYPIKWLADYAETGGLFAPEGETAESLTAAGISLEEKMQEAFYKLRGDRTSNVTIEKLLDPNSYFDLTFSIQSEAREKNKGSTGQTYTAVALLCIARLSRVEQGAQASKAPGLRFMPIDEAEGLGNNYDMLHKVAKDSDYQIISMSINPLSSSARDGRYLYDLRRSHEAGDDINLTPWLVMEEATDETSNR